MTYYTIMTSGYTTQHGDDARATGGVTLTELSRSAGGLRVRRTDSNGRWESSGRSEPITNSEAYDLLQRAADRGARNGGLSGAEVERISRLLRLA